MNSNPTLWLAAVRGGDGIAWGRLLDHFRPYLAFLAAAQLGRRLTVKADPLDLVQETMLQAHRKFHAFRGETGDEFAVWLEAILVSRVEKLVRRYYGTASRDLRLERELAAGIAESTRLLGTIPADPRDSPSRAASAREQAVKVATAVEKLTPEQQRVVARHLEGLTFPQIGEQMEKSTDAVTQLWVRAIKRLRQLMEESE